MSTADLSGELDLVVRESYDIEESVARYPIMFRSGSPLEDASFRDYFYFM